ncbi:MAG: GerMN domain-containing protein [Candidatus Wallbacteria bacterium]|nr:GerMN domain-containing protein [Candidatus Wallbacteria bacterium]
MSEGRESRSNRWFYLACSVAVLLLSWFVKPEAARAFLADQVDAVGALLGARRPPAAEAGRPSEPVSEGGASAVLSDPGRPLTLYYPSRAAAGMLEAYETAAGAVETPKELAAEVVNLLQAAPTDAGVQAPLPPGTRLLALFLEGGRATVDLSAELLSSAPVSTAETRVRLYCLVNSLTSLPFVEEVRFLIAGEERTSYFDCFDLTVPYRFNPDVVAGRGATRRNQ